MLGSSIPSQTFYSPAQKIGKGTLRSFVRFDRQGEVKSLGIVLSRSAFTQLPTQAKAYTLPLPKRGKVQSINHVGVDWNPQGHHPESIYSVPHFDFHFYTISPQQRLQITATGEDLARATQMPAPEFLPPNYVPTEDGAEPYQGSHWADSTAPEFQPPLHGFDKTFLYGFYDGKISFLEPMIARSTFAPQKGFTAAVPTPSQYAKAGVYPTRYKLIYNRKAKEYRVELTGLRRVASIQIT